MVIDFSSDLLADFLAEREVLSIFLDEEIESSVLVFCFRATFSRV